MINNAITTKSFWFSPLKKTSHFLLLLILIDIIVIAIIINYAYISANTCDKEITSNIYLSLGLSNCDPREIVSGVIYRISALLNINVIFLLLYSGFTSYTYNRRVVSLIVLAFILFLIASFF